MKPENKQAIAAAVYTENPEVFAYFDEGDRRSATFIDWIADRVGAKAFDLWWGAEDDEMTNLDQADMVAAVLDLASARA